MILIQMEKYQPLFVTKNLKIVWDLKILKKNFNNKWQMNKKWKMK